MGFNLKSLLPYAAGAVAGGVMNQFAPTRNYSALGSAAAGALTNKKSPVTGALQGFAGGGVGSAIGGGLSSKTGFGEGAMSGLKTYGNSIPGFGGVGTSNPTGVFAKWLTPSAMQGTSSMTKPGVAGSASGFSLNTPQQTQRMDVQRALGTMPAATTAAATGAPSSALPSSGGIQTAPLAKNGLMDKFLGGGSNMGQMAAGVVLPAVAGMMQPEYEAPDFSGDFAKINQEVANNPYRTQAAGYMSGQLQQPIGADAASARAVSALRNQRQKEQDIKSLTQQFVAANPGADLANNSAYQNALLNYNRDFAASEEAQNAQIQYTYDAQQRAQNLQIATELGSMGDDQINVLLAEMGINAQQAIQKAQYDAGRGQAMTDLASTIGAELVKRGLGTPKATVTA